MLSMNKLFTVITGLLLMVTSHAEAADFETAKDAVKNMGVGWNLGNTLDACSGSAQGLESETYWGQPKTKPELMKMMKEAGFSAIRVPVTWYNHMDADGKVDEAWMKRVHEIVDYVINQGLYCIVNVHHDTGDGKQWLHASTTTYNSNKAKFEYLWRQIASEFKDYDQKLLFEAYNEMLDDNNRWNEPAAQDGYDAINKYAKSFVSTVRNTGGNNKLRNLIVNTYSASSAPNAMKALELPETSGHIIFQLHSYPNWQNETNAKREIDNLISNIKSNLLNRAPVIIGEYATFTTWPSNIDYYDTNRSVALYAMDYLIKQTKIAGIGTFYWMGLSDGAARTTPVFNQADLAETLIKAYYGSTDGYTFPIYDTSKGTVVFEGEKQLEWGQAVNFPPSLFAELDNSTFVEVTYEQKHVEGYGMLQFWYNDWSVKIDFMVDGKNYSADFTPSDHYGTPDGTVHTTAFSFDENTFSNIKKKGVLFQGHGIVVKKAILTKTPTGISTIVVNSLGNEVLYNLNGQRVEKPQRGLYIQNGKKYMVK